MSNFISKVAKRNVAPVKQVKLKLVHIDFWSAVRNGFMVTLAMGLATMAGFFVVWLVISTTGLFGSLNSLLNSAAGGDAQQVDVAQTLSLPRVLSFAGTLAIVNIVGGTILSGVSALIFNVIARLSGGIRVGFTNE
ncbi:MAG: DUF3566 domain-containing protein [Rhodoluna sp.]|nr:DUF3566 domain-containing protein [Rhodoluna sp.]MBP6187158.1 DUF3566 domain-containing protein [Rhodoluna sp.]